MLSTSLGQGKWKVDLLLQQLGFFYAGKKKKKIGCYRWFEFEIFFEVTLIPLRKNPEFLKLADNTFTAITHRRWLYYGPHLGWKSLVVSGSFIVKWLQPLRSKRIFQVVINIPNCSIKKISQSSCKLHSKLVRMKNLNRKKYEGKLFRHNKTKKEIINLSPSRIKLKLKAHSNSSATGNY